MRRLVVKVKCSKWHYTSRLPNMCVSCNTPGPFPLHLPPPPCLPPCRRSAAAPAPAPVGAWPFEYQNCIVLSLVSKTVVHIGIFYQYLYHNPSALLFNYHPLHSESLPISRNQMSSKSGKKMDRLSVQNCSKPLAPMVAALS